MIEIRATEVNISRYDLTKARERRSARDGLVVHRDIPDDDGLIFQFETRSQQFRGGQGRFALQSYDCRTSVSPSCGAAMKGLASDRG